MPEIILTHYTRPNAVQTSVSFTVSNEAAQKYDTILSLGLRLTSEGINDSVALCVEDPERGDFLTKLVHYGPQVVAKLEAMLQEFSEDQYKQWADRIDQAEASEPAFGSDGPVDGEDFNR